MQVMETNQNNPVHQRIRQELQKLSDAGGIQAELIKEGAQDYVLFHQLETSGGTKGLPVFTDVLVTVPAGYPASPLDMPALPLNSPLAPYVVGGSNPQHTVNFQGSQWRFLSFHPYNGAGAPMWTPTKHGFHDYYQHLFTWLQKI
jgi:hypothetical protein